MTAWPDLPAVDELVLLPLGLPPMLLASIGYGGDARHVGLHWSSDHGRVDWFDGEIGLTGDSGPWRSFAEHPSVARVLAPYGQTQSDDRDYTLLADRWEQQLLIGQAATVSALVHSQPSQILADGMARGGSDEDLLDAICARVLGGGSDQSEREQRAVRRAQLAVEVVRVARTAPDVCELTALVLRYCSPAARRFQAPSIDGGSSETMLGCECAPCPSDSRSFGGQGCSASARSEPW